MLKQLDSPWVALVLDRATVPITRSLHASRVSPDSISVAAIICALVSGLLFSFGGRQAVLGLILFELGFLLDCVDGKLARLRGQSSPVGQFLDHYVGVIPKVIQSIGVFIAGARLVSDNLIGLTLVAGWAVIYILAMALVPETPPSSFELDHETLARPGGRLASWFRKRRAKPRPTPVEAEHIGFLAAAMPTAAAAIACLLLSTAFFVAAVALWYWKTWVALRDAEAFEG